MTRLRRGKFRVALICGGHAAEGTVSLHSARTIHDHLAYEEIEVLPVYFDIKRRPYVLSRALLYSNSLDLELRGWASALPPAGFKRFLSSVDLAFPVIHGRFGEDGGIQDILERAGCAFAGSGSLACSACFDKYNTGQALQRQGFYARPSQLLLQAKSQEIARQVEQFFRRHKITRAVIKPALGSSGIGVSSVVSVRQAVDHTLQLFAEGHARVVCEPFCEGAEFTVVVLQNRFLQPVCLPPLELATDGAAERIFDFRRRHLSCQELSHHCPPRFADGVIERIQAQAEQLFSLFGLRDFARIDGWFTKSGEIWFSDVNPVSSMEHDGYMFQLGALAGFTHRELVRWIVNSACLRSGRQLPELPLASTRPAKREDIQVLFGGSSDERQVSLKSGTNVWLKLLNSRRYNPLANLLDADGNVWRLPYWLPLYHTVEEVVRLCRAARRQEKRLRPLRERALMRLAACPNGLCGEDFFPEKISLAEFVKRSEFVFIALQGGWGEDGSLQKILERAGVPFNGARSKASLLCMDKAATGRVVAKLKRFGIYTAKREVLRSTSVLRQSPAQLGKLWENLLKKVGGSSLVVKPNRGGCAAGMVRLHSATDLEKYLSALARVEAHIPRGTLSDQLEIVEMPKKASLELIFESFIDGDQISVDHGKLRCKRSTGWVEITAGVFGARGKMRVFTPSIRVAAGDVPPAEAKVYLGAWISTTQVPQEYISGAVFHKAARRISRVAKVLGLRGYAQIDAFMHTGSGEIFVIEANSLPALTPGAVLFDQALHELHPLYASEFLEKIVALEFT